MVVFVVGSKLSRLIARYEPYKLERRRREHLSTGETKASNEDKTWLLKPSVAAGNSGPDGRERGQGSAGTNERKNTTRS